MVVVVVVVVVPLGAITTPEFLLFYRISVTGFLEFNMMASVGVLTEVSLTFR